MSILTSCNSRACLAAMLLIAAALAGCGNTNRMGEAPPEPPPSSILLPLAQPIIETTAQSIIEPTPTLFVLDPLIDSNLDLMAGPEAIPLELKIPSLGVNAPILDVGLTADNVMDSPKGQIGDAVWGSAFWYRGGNIPGDSGTATIAGHVNDPLGRPEIFAHLEDLQPGDLIIIHLKNTTMDIHFVVDQSTVYSVKESTDPAVLTQIYGAGPVAGTGPQPSPDGHAHLTLITCAGYIVDGEFDHHTVVFATRSENSSP